MNYIIDSNTLKFLNRDIINFDYPIHESLEVDNVLIVVLDVPNGISDRQNVFAFNALGDVLWQIGTVELFYDGDYCPFIGVEINNNGEVVIFNWCDTAVIINPQTGAVVRTYITK